MVSSDFQVDCPCDVAQTLFFYCFNVSGKQNQRSGLLQASKSTIYLNIQLQTRIVKLLCNAKNIISISSTDKKTLTNVFV